MKRFFVFLLCASLLFSLVSCGGGLVEETQTQGNLQETETAEETVNIPYVNDRLNWEKINSFPIANSSMSIEELRRLCVDFFRFSQSFAWTLDEDWTYEDHNFTMPMKKGVVYGGLPYMTGTGNVYRLMEHYDPETGVVDISEAGKIKIHFGNVCSSGASWGHARVVNSANYGFTETMVPKNGFIPIGPYTMDETIKGFGEKYDTSSITTANGKQVMFQSYANLRLADAVVCFRTKAGHIQMCSLDPVVVFNSDGTINGAESYIRIIDQGSSWKIKQQSDGTNYTVQGGVDEKVSFNKLYNEAYIPYTFAEFLGQDPIEETECSVNFEGESVSLDTLCKSTVTANYYLSDVYVDILDKDGNVVKTKSCHVDDFGIFSLELSKSVFPTPLKQYANGEFTVRLTAQLGNGARPVIYTGSLTK